MAGQLREFPADLWIRVGAGHGLGALYAIPEFRTEARGSRTRMEHGAPGGAAHAIVAAYSIQSAAHDSRPYRMGPEGRAVHGRAARGSAAPAAERRGTRLLEAERRATIRQIVFGAAAAAFRGSVDRGSAVEPGPPCRVGAEPDSAAAGRKRRGPGIGGPSRPRHGAHPRPADA